MKPHPKTLALVALASGMLASAYFIGPAPAAPAVPGAARPIPAMAVAAPKPASTIKTFQAPVPMLVSRHDKFFDVSSVSDTAAPVQTASATTDQQATASDAAARASIERDGYRNVRGLVRGPNGAWRGKAMRGGTEIAVSVDPNGNVSQD